MDASREMPDSNPALCGFDCGRRAESDYVDAYSISGKTQSAGKLAELQTLVRIFNVRASDRFRVQPLQQ
jgi:hypothetical protein